MLFVNDCAAMTRLALSLSLIVLLLPRIARSQSARDGRLLITVTDPTGAVVRNGTVTVNGLDEATKTSTASSVLTRTRDSRRSQS